MYSITIRTACITCKNAKERQSVAEQISWECDQIENTLLSLQREAEVGRMMLLCHGQLHSEVIFDECKVLEGIQPIFLILW